MTPLAHAIIARAARITAARDRELAQALKISARVRDLKQMAEDTSEAYRRALAASGLPPEHFRLRAMLLGLLPLPRKGT